MKARLIQEIGMKGRLRIYWDSSVMTAVTPESRSWKDDQTCPNCLGTGKPGYHNAYTMLGTVPKGTDAHKHFGKVEDYPEDMWPKVCAYCAAPVPEGKLDFRPAGETVGAKGVWGNRQVFTSRLYNTDSGEPEPGDLFETDWHDPGHCPFWDNCSGVHLYAILPNGEHWDLHSRASNCTMKDDRTHRCWIVNGTPPNLTVNKSGFTCAAGAGSIAVTGYHGFLTNGEFTP